MTIFSIGSRVSPLAMAQARRVQALLAAALGAQPQDFPILGFKTTGDQIQDRSLNDAGGKGLFTKELDEALMRGEIGAAVHSLKDVPTRLPDGLVLAAVPEREDPRDAFVSLKARDLSGLPPGAVVGSASLRRQAQVLHARGDLKVTLLRGSVETRLKRLQEGVIDATFLALAGLKRLGLERHATSLVSEDAMLPAAAQGALGVVAKADDARACGHIARIDDAAVRACVEAERAFLDVLDGSCRMPIAALARISGTTLSLSGEVLTPDGRERWREAGEGALGTHPFDDAAALGRRLGFLVKQKAGPALDAIARGAGDWRGSTA
jgi:hydroxymethylbilane synthase